MHNCKTTTNRITELLLDSPDARPDDLLSKELIRCAECRTEFDDLKQTLRITRQTLENAITPPSSWNEYNERLRLRLVNSHVENKPNGQSWLQSFFRSSIRVPIPALSAFVILFVAGLLFALVAFPRKVVITQTVSVPVEVPVVQEKVVSRIVYRDRVVTRVLRSTNKAPFDSTVAKTQAESRPAALIGLKPLDEVKLTVIKGGLPNEK